MMRPNAVNRALYRKEWKFIYFVRGALRYIFTKRFAQHRLQNLLDEVASRSDREYIESRVEYYNRLLPLPERPEGLRPLSEHRVGSLKSAYFFDSYEYTRFFSDKLYWNILAGDIVNVPDVPTIVKSRPVVGDLSNAVLLNLDKHRHFFFVRDDIPFREKSNMAIFRCNVNYPHPNHVTRLRFVEQYYGHPLCDVGVSNPSPVVKDEWLRPYISEYDHLTYKFIMCLEGNDVATNLKWVMSSNSLAVMPRPRYETWFMEGSLIPDYHYVEVKSDYSDLAEKLQYYIDHPAEAEAIVQHAHDYIAQFRDAHREKLISLLVLDRYFRCCNP